MVVFFSNSEDAAADTRADVFDELLVAHLALAGRIIQVHDLHSFVFAHREVQLPHGVACVTSKSDEEPHTDTARARNSP